MKKVQILTKDGELVIQATMDGNERITYYGRGLESITIARTFLDALGLIIKEVEEKKPVVRWLWARQIIYPNIALHWTMVQGGIFYSDEEMGKFEWTSGKAPPLKKLEWSRTEFEE